MGWLEGPKDGKFVGSAVGCTVGIPDGLNSGCCDGSLDGINVGCLEGSTVG